MRGPRRSVRLVHPRDGMRTGGAVPTLSLLSVFLAVSWLAEARKNPPPHPFENTIVARGIVEPAGERTVSVGPPAAGVVSSVLVAVGDVVSRGAPLFRLDTRALEAERSVRSAALDLAKAKLQGVEARPRPEDLAPARARVEQAEAALADLKAQLARLEKAQATGRGVVALDELDQRRYRALVAEKALAQARAELEVVKAGAPLAEVLEARAEVARAEALVGQIDTEIERATVLAPLDATVLEVRAREGMYAQPPGDLVLLGNTRQLDVRVEVAEDQAPLVRPGCRAVARIRSLTEGLPLELARIEPFVRPGTRALQVVFRLGSAPGPVYVGQQVDVFIEGAR